MRINLFLLVSLVGCAILLAWQAIDKHGQVSHLRERLENKQRVIEDMLELWPDATNQHTNRHIAVPVPRPKPYVWSTQDPPIAEIDFEKILGGQPAIDAREMISPLPAAPATPVQEKKPIKKEKP